MFSFHETLRTLKLKLYFIAATDPTIPQGLLLGR